jgi:hypothetical protein
LARIFLNGAVGGGQDIARANAPNSASGDGNIAFVATHWDFSAGDFVELGVKHNASGTLDVEAAPKFTAEFGIVKLP